MTTKNGPFTKKADFLRIFMTALFLGAAILLTSSPALCAPSNGAPPANGPFRLNVGDTFYYSIQWQDQLVGYSKFTVSKRMVLAGEAFYNVDSYSHLKIGLGQVQQLTFTSQTTVREDNLEPTFFRCSQGIGGKTMAVDCLVSANLIAQKNDSPAGPGEVMISLEDGRVPFFFIHNLWGRINTLTEQYWLILISERAGGVYAYDPVLQYKGNLQVEKGETEDITVGGRTVKAKCYTISGFSGTGGARVWVDGRKNILKIKDSGGLVFESVGRDIASKLKSSPGVDLWKTQTSFSDIFIPDASKVDRMKAVLTFRGTGLELENLKLAGYEQTFNGQETDGVISGEFSVKTSLPRIDNPPAFPVTADFPQDVVPYTRPALGIESDDDLVKNKAMEATWKAENMWDASRKISRWIAENVPSGIALPSAKMTLINEQGNGESKALLAVAMCRSMGIPARKAGGIAFVGGSFIPHYWFEVYTGQSGWAPLDPSSANSDFIGAARVRLFSSGEVWDLSVKVDQFNPTPPSRVTFINKELTWPVGEQRVYVLKKKGEIIGREKARIAEVSVVEDTETYRLDMESTLEVGSDKTEAKAVYLVTPQGLPFRYEKTVILGAQKESHKYQAKDHFLIEYLGVDKGERQLKIPFSTGSYLVDSHFLCQWVLIAGQFGDMVIGKNVSFTVFIPETYSFEEIRAQVKQFESVETGEKIFDAFRVETNKGVVFWIEKDTGRVVKLSFPAQEVDLELESVDLKI